MKMKKLILMMAIAAAGAGGCEKRPEPLKIDNALTAEEIAAGRLTPEVMWKMSRAGGSSDRKSTRLNSSHRSLSRMPSSA